MAEMLPAETAANVVAVTTESHTQMTPMELLSRAVATGAGVETLERLIALHERMEQSRARKAFAAAMADAKARIKPIPKGNTVDFNTNKGGRTNYAFEGMGDIALAIDPILADYGLSYRHRAKQNGNKLAVTCIVEHRDGYFEETTLEAGEDHSGNKNSIQAVGSTATYLQRYSLKLALGLAASKDDDGRGAVGSQQDDGRPSQEPHHKAEANNPGKPSASQNAGVNCAKIVWAENSEPVMVPDTELYQAISSAADRVVSNKDSDLNAVIAFKTRNAEELRKWCHRNGRDAMRMLADVFNGVDAEAAKRASEQQQAA